MSTETTARHRSATNANHPMNVVESVLNGFICLSDIPKEFIKKGDDGKLYLQISVSPRKEVGTKGNDTTIAVNKTKEEREANPETIYIGGGRIFYFKKDNTPTNFTPADESDYDDLPF